MVAVLSRACADKSAVLIIQHTPPRVKGILGCPGGSRKSVRSGLYYFTLEVSGRRIVRSFVFVR